jgi:hypothetical protein
LRKIGRFAAIRGRAVDDLFIAGARPSRRAARSRRRLSVDLNRDCDQTNAGDRPQF